jgi:RES domain-containing protein
MEVFRLVRKKYPNALSGMGAARMGARWNTDDVSHVSRATDDVSHVSRATDDASHVSRDTDDGAHTSMLIYTAGNRSLAMVEIAVHFSLATLPSDYFMYTIFIPDDTTLKVIQTEDLPPSWNQFPHNTSTRIFGDRFIRENTHCLLKVPSAVTKGDFNILINPFHAEFKYIRILESEKFPFDWRIFR